MRVAVIGGGPSGLVTLKYFLEAKQSLGVEAIEARLFESEPEVGGTFSFRTYENAELVSSKQLTCFSDFRPHQNTTDFLSVTEYIQYLKDYCAAFDLWPHIYLSKKVIGVSREPGSAHAVTYLDTNTNEKDTWECDAVAVCSGLHVLPNMPKLEGIENVPSYMHSSDFKKTDQLGQNKTILVLGAGETAADVAYMAVTAPTKRVIWSHRSGFHLAPKRNPAPTILPILGFKKDPKYQSVPVDTSRASLFDTAYVHPLLRNSMVLWYYYEFYVKSILLTTYGTPHGMDQWVGGIPTAQHKTWKIFFNKASKVAPYISAPYRPQETIWSRIRKAILQPPPVPDLHGRQVDLASWPMRIDEKGLVHFTNNGRPEFERMKDEQVKPDIVIFCTGYRQEFAFLGKGYPTAEEADVRDVWKRDDPSIGFIGFVRPSLGAIPPLSEMQAQLWILRIAAPSRIAGPLLSTEEQHYRLLRSKDARIQYGVDHESYAYQLALDMDSALSIWEALSLGYHISWKLPLVWALGANYNAKFRLRGPWKWTGATDVLTTELWETIARRQIFFGHITLSAIPMLIFGPLSLLSWLYCAVFRTVKH